MGKRDFFQVSAQYTILQSHLPEKISYLVCQIIPLCDKKPENTDSSFVGGWTG